MNTFFVSSTFRDMQFERDAIQEKVLPKLNAVARKYGQTVSFCDLRWGINTMDLDAEAGMRSVLEVCLDQIDRCEPPMIVLLGERYGSIPGTDLIKEAADRKHLMLKDYELSVTALEIAYGALENKNSHPNALFYFRKIKNPPADYCSEDEEHAQKLDLLKKKIESLNGVKIRTYETEWTDSGLTGCDVFADMLAQDIQNIMQPRWEKQFALSPFEREREIQWRFISERARLFRGREDVVEDILRRLNEGELLISVKGKAGSGKSTLYAKVAERLAEEGWEVLPFAGGLTSESNDARDITVNLIRYFESKLKDGSAHGDDLNNSLSPDELTKRVDELAQKYLVGDKKLIVMVDAVDQLYKDDFRDKLAFIPKRLFENFRYIVTSTYDFDGLHADCVELADLTADRKRAVIDGILSRYGKTLDDGVIAEILKMPASDSPLYLSFLVMRLMMMNREDFDSIGTMGGGMEAISMRQKQIIASCPADAEEMCAELLSEAALRIDASLIERVTALMACSRFGLRECDLRALTGDKWNILNFAHFLSYMSDCFIMRDDGRIDFSHKSIRAGILKKIDVVKTHGEILAYLTTLPDDDGIKKQETIFHIIGANDKDAFRAYVCDAIADVSAEQGYLPLYYNLREQTFADEGKWVSSVIAQTDVNENALPFVAVMFTVVQMFVSTYTNVQAGLAINRELVALLQKLVSAGVKGAEALLYSAKQGLGISIAQSGKEGGGVDLFLDVCGYYLDEYIQSKDVNTLRSLASACCVLVPNLAFAEQIGAQKSARIKQINKIALTEAETLYRASPQKDTAITYCFALFADMYRLVIIQDFSTASRNFQTITDVLTKYAEEFVEQELIQITLMIGETFSSVQLEAGISSSYQTLTTEMFAGANTLQGLSRSDGTAQILRLVQQVGDLDLKMAQFVYKKFGTEYYLYRYITALNNYGIRLINDGKYGQAVQNAYETLDILHDGSSQTLSDGFRWAEIGLKFTLTLGYTCLGNWDKARVFADEALRELENMSAMDSYVTKQMLASLYMIYIFSVQNADDNYFDNIDELKQVVEKTEKFFDVLDGSPQLREIYGMQLPHILFMGAISMNILIEHEEERSLQPDHLKRCALWCSTAMGYYYEMVQAGAPSETLNDILDMLRDVMFDCLDRAEEHLSQREYFDMLDMFSNYVIDPLDGDEDEDDDLDEDGSDEDEDFDDDEDDDDEDFDEDFGEDVEWTEEELKSIGLTDEDLEILGIRPSDKKAPAKDGDQGSADEDEDDEDDFDDDDDGESDDDGSDDSENDDDDDNDGDDEDDGHVFRNRNHRPTDD